MPMPTKETLNDGYLSGKEVAAMCRVNLATIYRWVAAKQFPAAIRLSGNCVRWKLSEVNAWLSSRPRVQLVG